MNQMASYTLSLYSLENAETFKLFTDYDFYLEENKKNFEKKFFDKYFDREIYCKNPFVFRRALLGKLNLIMPYYKQLYQTELESKNINFLLNKDLKEEFIRDIENNVDVLNSNAPFVVDKLQEYKYELEREILTFFGLNNNFEKKERMLTDDINSNNDYINSIIDLMYKSRKEGIEKINKKYGLNIIVEKVNGIEENVSRETLEGGKE